MGFRLWPKAETRTKLCSGCKEQLAWDATYCEHCGAGTPPPPTPSLYDRRIRPYLGLTIGLVALVGLLLGGWMLKQHLAEQDERSEELQLRKGELDEQIRDLRQRKGEAEAKAQEWTALARKWRKLYEAKEEEQARAEAERFFAVVTKLDAEIDAVLDEKLAVEKRLRALGP